jgi:hypothetical protein
VGEEGLIHGKKAAVAGRDHVASLLHRKMEKSFFVDAYLPLDYGVQMVIVSVLPRRLLSPR